jgi:nucleoside 2-deoxyribosyltransferase
MESQAHDAGKGSSRMSREQPPPTIVVYISGPMSGLPDFNRQAFREAEAVLQSQGYTVLNPATHPHGLSYAQYMDIDMAMVRCADVVIALPGWEASNGAQAEIAYAKCLKKPVILWLTQEDNAQYDPTRKKREREVAHGSGNLS